MMDIEAWVRPNIRKMAPYSSARHEFSGNARIWLDANENPYGSPGKDNGHSFNRYPDPGQQALKEKISRIKGVPPENIFIGNGSDEPIDLLFRIFCEPGRDNVILLPPTYGMYEVCAAMNNVEIRPVPLDERFQPDLEGIAAAVDENSRLLFLCSPNNPTGNSMDRTCVEVLLNNFEGIVVVDEAYINYARQHSFINELTEYPNLVVLQTLSKAWGLAGLRIGMAFAGSLVTGYLNKVKYPYNIGTATQQLALQALDELDTVNAWTRQTVEEREWLRKQLTELSFVQTVYPSDANFILVKMADARGVYEQLSAQGIIVRDRSRVILCDNCLRITVGTPDENRQLLAALQQLP